jgi:hypothetical protein
MKAKCGSVPIKSFVVMMWISDWQSVKPRDYVRCVHFIRVICHQVRLRFGQEC